MAVKSAVYDYSLYTPDYYLKGFLAGGVCCSVTHGGATPIDFVKTRMQLVPELGSKGLFGATKEIIASEGAGALTTGMSATAAAYARPVSSPASSRRSAPTRRTRSSRS